MRYLIAFMLLIGCAAAQNTMQPSAWGSSWNHIPPVTWPPTDSNGTTASITGFRIWDDGNKWSQIETSAGVFNWTKMDTIMNTLVTSPVMNTIYTVGATPQWAGTCSAAADPSLCLPGPLGSGFGGGTQCASPSDYSCLPPSDVNNDGTGTDAQFNTFIATLTARYPNKITYYEEINESDSPNFWCPGGGATGCPTSQQSLNIEVRMMWDMRNIVHCVSPTSKIVGPAFHSATALVWGHNYAITSISAPAGVSGVNGVPVGCNWNAATVTGAQTWDVTNFHDHFTTPDAPFIAAYNNVATEISNDSLATTLFEDEYGCELCTNSDDRAAYYGAALAIRASVGPPYIVATYQYQWDSGGGLALQGDISGLAYDVEIGWLNLSAVATFTHASSIYTVPLVTAAGRVGLIAWDTSQSSTCGSGCPTHVFGSQFTTWTNLAGVVSSTTLGSGTAPLGLKPIFLLTNPASNSANTVNREGILQ